MILYVGYKAVYSSAEDFPDYFDTVLMAGFSLVIAYFMGVVFYEDALFFLMSGEQTFPSHHISIAYPLSMGLLYFRGLEKGWASLVVVAFIYWSRMQLEIHTLAELNAGLVAGLTAFWLVLGMRKFEVNYLGRLRELFDYAFRFGQRDT